MDIQVFTTYEEAAAHLSFAQMDAIDFMQKFEELEIESVTIQNEGRILVRAYSSGDTYGIEVRYDYFGRVISQSSYFRK